MTDRTLRFTRRLTPRAALAACAIGAWLTVSAAPAHAQASAAIRAAAKEVAEAFGGAGAKAGAGAAARDLAGLGGEAAVRELLERVAVESGEAGAQRVAALMRSQGIEAFIAARSMAPMQVAPVLTAVDDLARAAPELAAPALRALTREGEGQALAALTTRFGAPALEAAARHPGVGVGLVGRLGDEGATLARSLSTEQVVGVVRHADAIAELPSAQRSGVTALIAKAPEKAVAFLEKHPKFFLIGGAGAILLANSDALLNGTADVVIGPDGSPMLVHKSGLIERAVLAPLMRWLLPVLAGLLALWGGLKLFWLWADRRASAARRV